MDDAIAGCIGSVAVGAVLGAVIGNNSGSGDAGTGAAVGAAIGGAACAVLVAIANEQDRARIQQLERQAVASGASRTDSFTAQDGKNVTLTTTVQEAPAEIRPGSSCRFSEKQVSSAAGRASVGRELWCRTETGDWQLTS